MRQRRSTGLALLAALSLAGAACGSGQAVSTGVEPGETPVSSPVPTTASEAETPTEGLPMFQLDPQAAAGWVPVEAGRDGDGGPVSPLQPPNGPWNALVYARPRLEPSPFPPPQVALLVQQDPVRYSSDEHAVQVGGQPATIGRVYVGDGLDTPVLSWSPQPGVTVLLAVHGGEDEVDLQQLAAAVRPLDDTEWAKLRKGVQPRWTDARADPDSQRVDVLSGSVGGRSWQLTAVVPSEFPLGPWDNRQTCADLTFDGVTVTDTFCGLGWSLPLVSGQRFIFGVADDNATEVTVRSVTIDGTPTGLVEITAATSEARPEVPGRFYAAVVDSGHCFYQVDGAKMWAPNQVIRPTGRIEIDPCGIDPTQLLPPSTVAAN